MKRFSWTLDGLKVGLFFPLLYTLPMYQTNMYNAAHYNIYRTQLIQCHRNAKMNSSTRFEILACTYTKQTPRVFSLFWYFLGEKKALKRIKPSTLCSRFCLYIWRSIFLSDCVFDGASNRIPLLPLTLARSLSVCVCFSFNFIQVKER